MQNLNFEDFKNMGGFADETAFNRYIDKACAVIDNATFGRFENVAERPKKLLCCVRDLVDFYNANEVKNGSVAVTSRSQSVGGVSESESYNVKNDEEIGQEVSNIIYDYLANVRDANGVSVLYRGSGK